MIEIVSIDELKYGDIILADGMSDDNDCHVFTIEAIWQDGSLTFENTMLDYAPEDPDRIIRIGHKGNHNRLLIETLDIQVAVNEKLDK